MQGRIVDINRDIIRIVFEESSSEFDMVTDRWSIKIDQFETWTLDDYAWRESALVGTTK